LFNDEKIITEHTDQFAFFLDDKLEKNLAGKTLEQLFPDLIEASP
jgi:hypothetical protein